ncbi:hypothetical protein [Actinomadura opuntiae]|uniref:hypothetical protein n=1 Tax=Actinomadura sp. OS1-43 TaxID=604315 RepID=UPI00255A813A|nr:hypothetical protein [Actinomadura sp. OS1-43]MDL4812726.1 hypothetical protein [Actinomadura sp. OS1-43]
MTAQTIAVRRTPSRREVEAIAYRAMTFPNMSHADDLAEVAPHLTPAERDAALADLVDAIRLRDAACRACTAASADVAAVLAEHADPLTARAAKAGHLLVDALTAARTRAQIAARDLDAIDGLDANVDGARAELDDVRDGYTTPAEMDADTDPDRMEEAAEQKLTAALANLSFVVEHRLEKLLIDLTRAAWRHCDTTRLHMTGGAV